MARELKHSRTLAEMVRGWTDDQVMRLLAARPDLTTPAPHDSASLASRAATRSSVLRALDQLTLLELSVLDALVVQGQSTRADLVATIRADPAVVEVALTRLEDVLLIWQTSTGLRPLSGVADALRGDLTVGVSGLQRRSAHPDPAQGIAAHLAALTPAARAMLTHVVDHGGQAATGRVRVVSPEQASTPQEELVARRLLRLGDAGVATVPGEVGLAVRGGFTTVEAVASCPALATTDRDTEMVERGAAGAAFETVRRIELLLDQWGQRPPGVLRSGGLGVRELKSVAALLHLDEKPAAFVVELARGAGLLAEGVTADGNPSWLPTDAFDKWADLTPDARWLALVRPWLLGNRVPELVGGRDEAGKTRNALTPELSSLLAPETRHMTLAALAELPPGACLAHGTGLPSLAALLRWERPRRPATRDQLVAWAVEEASALGLLGLGALTRAGRALLGTEPEAAATLIAPYLPQPVDHVLLQADLTAVAPGPLVGDLARNLHLVADVESRGGASVHRFSPASVRRAFDAGWTAGEVHTFLAEISRTPVPQALHYLIDDVSRTFGSVRVGYAEAFLRSDDEAALTALLHHPQAAGLGLRRIAPTVLISSTPLDVLLPRLREAGAAPVVEATDGTVRVARPDLLRARTPKPDRSASAIAAKASAAEAAVVSAIRAGDRAAAAAGPQSGTTTTPTDALNMLRDAVESGTTVLIGYLDNHGSSTERLVEPLRVEGGQLTAHDQRSSEVRHFAVHRITAVTRRPH